MSFKFNAILKFNSAQATRGMKTAGRGFQRMSKNIRGAGAALGKMNQGMRGLALAGLPATAAIGFATKTFADFEFQMKTVQSVLLATDNEMKSLTNQAKLMGATTEFSAIQASQGQEALARAGLSTKQIMGALSGVMAAASASSTDLATATDIVVGQLGAFGLEAKEAGRVADAMALTTALTNTNFIQLGEAMKFAAPELKGLGITIEETASSIGVLANAGIKGSLAGTAIKNAFVKLSKPTKKTLELFGGREGFNAQLLEIGENGEKKLKPMEVIMANITKVVRASKNPLEAAAKASEIFGLRGKAAQNAFAAALGQNIIITEKNIGALIRGAKKTGETMAFELGKPIPKLVALRLQIAGATGTAQRMRDIKMNSLTGQVILLKSAFEGINIELGEVFAGITRNLVGKATDFFSILTVGFQAAKDGGKASEAQLKSLNNNGFKEMLPVMIEFAQGFIEGFKEIVAVGKETFNAISEFLKPILGGTSLTTKEIGKLVAKILVIGAVAAPILGGIAAAFFVLGPIITGISGAISFIGSIIGIVVGIAQFGFGIIFSVISVLLSPISLITLAIAGIALVIAGVVKNWENIKTAFLDKGIIAGFKAIGDGIAMFLEKPLNAVKEKWLSIKSFFGFGGGKDSKIGTAAKGLGGGNNVDEISESAKIQAESVSQKVLAQPPSAEKVAKAVSSQSTGQGTSIGGGGGGGGTVVHEIVLKRGAEKIFTKAVTKGAVENAERQGKTISNKRRLIQNGFAVTQ